MKLWSKPACTVFEFGQSNFSSFLHFNTPLMSSWRCWQQVFSVPPLPLHKTKAAMKALHSILKDSQVFVLSFQNCSPDTLSFPFQTFSTDISSLGLTCSSNSCQQVLSQSTPSVKAFTLPRPVKFAPSTSLPESYSLPKNILLRGGFDLSILV